MSSRLWACGLALVLIVAAFGPAAMAAVQDGPRDSAAMSPRVDELLIEWWKIAGIHPAPPADEAEFLRRASLDLTGSIPSVWRVRLFLADSQPDKRARLIDELLESPRHSAHLADVWLNLLLRDQDANERQGVEGFRRWLRERFDKNLRYDNLAADLLTADGRVGRSGAALFFTSLDVDAKEIATSTSRIFLGVQIHCAQCHDHPDNDWKQGDFWGYAAFFARLRQENTQGVRGGPVLVEANQGELTLPDSETVVKPAYLNRQPADDAAPGTRRRKLAIWLASADNPYFAAATVNRVWALLFGRGLTEPIDDQGPHNPPKNGQLLDELAAYFISTGFDLRDLLRTLANTRAYQLSSRTGEGQSENAEDFFARMAIKNFTAEQLYDCLASATGLREPAAAPGAGPRPDVNQGRAAFVMKFRTTSSDRTDFQFGIPQALTLMNGRLIGRATDLQQLGVLRALEAPFLNDQQRVEILFLSTLSRFPRPAEREKFVQYVRSRDEKQRPSALADVLWALVNSAEFVLNH